ncbi:MAG: lytic transglycosylase domain-containing protein, partial [Xanthobacteraceae bacterium]
MATAGSLALMVGAQAASETTAKAGAAKTAAAKTAATKTTATKGAATKPAAGKPADKAAAAKPHAAKPHAAKSHEAKPDAKSTATKSDAAKSHAAKPKAAEKPKAAAKPNAAAAKPHPAAASATPRPQPLVRAERKQSLPAVVAATSSTSQADLGALQNVIDLVRRNKQAEATQTQAAIGDPVARKLAEWLILRSPDNGISVDRYRAFIAANPGWPSQIFLRRRAEAALWDDRRDDATVLAWFQNETPLSTKGKLVLARALLARGERANAERLVRDAWVADDVVSLAMESTILDQFGALLRPGDHKARMDALLYG